jgi:hypothetical protein
MVKSGGGECTRNRHVPLLGFISLVRVDDGNSGPVS